MTDDFGHWFAGFTDGEGCFTMGRQNHTKYAWYCGFQIGLRRDDLPILEMIKDELGAGNIYLVDQKDDIKGRKPQAHFRIHNRRGAMILRDTFRDHPLRSKKARDFEVWATAVDLWLSKPLNTHRSPLFDEIMTDLYQRLRDGRVYDAPPATELLAELVAAEPEQLTIETAGKAAALKLDALVRGPN